MADINYKREPAKRMFSGELKNCKFSEKFSTDEKSPTFVISPTGEIAARILIVGILTEKEKTTTKDKTTSIFKARIHDGVGEFFVSASSYQQEAMIQLSRIETPSIVAVVGKPKVFTREDGNIFTSVNAENITVVNKETREMWKLETARATLDRIEAMEKGGIKSIENIKDRYNTNLDTYKSMVNKALTKNA